MKKHPAIKHFSLLVINHRHERNITQKDLAELCDCHVNTLNNIERGVQHPTFLMAMRISKVLNISIDAIMEKALDDVVV
jgi:DNA-binding XRE family transcriptional regulator